jgi:hypothetical protein
MAPQGAGNYRQKTRFASFDNVPEMLRMWHVAADVKTIEGLFCGSEARTDQSERPA